MAKSDKASPAKGGRQLTVVDSAGKRHRFLRGMITHDLVQRGLDFDVAYAVAATTRDKLSGREEVSTEEIREAIQAELESRLGPDLPRHLTERVQTVVDLRVLHRGSEQPFSRGVLARSIVAAGIELELAYPLVTELRERLGQEGVEVIPSSEIARQVAALLEEKVGPEAARRYRLVRRIHRMPRPLVVYVGGGSGTGKSTLALELAPLLRVYRLNATDTIRQVMRMVFSSSMLPSLHSSSFEIADPLSGEIEPAGSPRDPDYVTQLTDSFSEQAQRVLVGVRAVVERAIAENMSVIVEGVHLYPPLVPFKDLEGAVHQLPLMLGTLDEEVHRTRFLARARLGGRRADRYVENFASIRVVHDYLLQQAENHGIPLLDTSRPELQVARTLRLITGMLERRLPVEAESPKSPTLLVILDGMADRPVRELGGRTPLEAADTPTLDRLAREGLCGLADPVAPGVVPDTAAGSLAIFAQTPLALKRGPVEALGAGFFLSAEDIAIRANLATLDEEGNIRDRRAGRIREGTAELAAALDRLPLPGSLSDEIEVRVRPGTEHRLAVVLRGRGLSTAFQGSDPGGAAPGPPLTPTPDDPGDAKAVFTARALALFEQEARKVLAKHKVNRRRVKDDLPPANAILTREPGRIHHLIPLEEAGFPLRLACIAGDRTVLGLASWLGAAPITSPEMTANLDTDLTAKIKTARKALKKNDLVVLHIKGADIAAHDQRPDLKMSFLEQVDQALGEMLDDFSGPLRVAVAGDHATLSESGQHGADPMPVLIWGEGVEADGVERFDEASVAGGGLQRFPLQMLLGRLFDLS